MKKLACLAVSLALSATPLLAQSAKNAVQVSSLTLVESTDDSGGWVTILGDESIFGDEAVRLHTSQQKDLIFGVSLECGLYTRTQVKSSGGNKDTSNARATVQVRVVVDPGTGSERTAAPGDVTFCEREQQLSATLQGIIENLACFPDGVFDPDADGCVLTDEEIELVIRTLSANAFFFALDDLGAATHNIIVQARITSSEATSDGSGGPGKGEAEASALIGKGAVTVEEVRLLRGTDIDLAP